MHHISSEASCYFNCVFSSPMAYVILFVLAAAVLLFILYLTISEPGNRIKFFAGGQILVIAAVWLSFTTMECYPMFSINIYMIYTFMTLSLMFLIPGFFHRLLVKRLNASPIMNIMGWAQKFVDDLVTGARVYYFDSAIPRAFACGRSIFVSIGLLEILTDEEIKAVLAHESWHLMHNNKTNWLKQLSMITFLPIVRTDIEQLADIYASELMGKNTLDSARSKLFCESSRF